MQSYRQQGYTGTVVPNKMNHVQRAVTYPTARNAMGDFSASHTTGTPAQPYRAAKVPGQSTHAVTHTVNGVPTYGQAGTISRLSAGGVPPPQNLPGTRGPQNSAFAPMSTKVSAVANNLGHGVSPGQGSVNNGVAKTGLG